MATGRSRGKTQATDPEGTAISPPEETDLVAMGVDPSALLDLARDTSESAREQLRSLTPVQLASAVTALTTKDRADFLLHVERVEEIVPEIPAAELTTTIRGTGLEDAGWLIEHASPEQRVAAVDLDCWKDRRFSAERLFEWIDAMIEAGTETLVAAFDELDPELWVLAMKTMADFSFGADSPEGDGRPTADGYVFYEPRSSDGEDRLQTILNTALSESPSHYWRFVQGAMLASRRECEEDAARWHRGRMNDLGFPDREHAMGAYRPLRPEAVAIEPDGLEHEPTRALVSTGRPPALVVGTLVGRALEDLPAGRAREILGSVLHVANALAVADELPLAEPGAVDGSLQKALRGIERGLAELAKQRNQALSVVMDRVPAMDLFRVGVAQDPSLRPRRSREEQIEREKERDWSVETEEIDPEDRVIGEDGWLRR